jgi:hypothetical protein
VYHWTKYVKKSVSIVFHKYVENWSESDNGTVILQDQLMHPFDAISAPGPLNSQVACSKFMCDFFHYSGKGKPWYHSPVPEALLPIPEGTMVDDPGRVWWSTLKELDEELIMGLNFTNWTMAGTRPDLGFWANRQDLTRHVETTAETASK